MASETGASMRDPKQTPAQQSGTPTRGEIILFKARAAGAPMETSPETPALTFTWEALERQLTALAVSDRCKALAPTLVSATRKQATFKPPELVLREVLCIASVLMDESFHPDGEEGEMT